MRHVPILGGDRPGATLGPEWLELQCHGVDGKGGCDRTWSGRGTAECRAKLRSAQGHANRLGHTVGGEHANAR